MMCRPHWKLDEGSKASTGSARTELKTSPGRINRVLLLIARNSQAPAEPARLALADGVIGAGTHPAIAPAPLVRLAGGANGVCAAALSVNWSLTPIVLCLSSVPDVSAQLGDELV
jgi:hypothetical protein